ncbi:hypothetical protein PGB90_006686 [Kerria lacca]
MVMHARKLPRINDGYYERHQQGHSSYQNSKYNSSKGSSYPDRYNQERSDRSRNSPNGNTSRSNTPERDHSPRNRTYGNKAWYLQKLHEKERDRQYRSDQGREKQNNKEKYYSSDYSRSPKDRRPVNKESGYPTNHDRNNSDKSSIVSNKNSGQPYGSSKDFQRKPAHNTVREKRDERERILKVGDWSEHTSSSGKKYYYNCKTEVSQWEKPREWLEKEGLSHLIRPSGSSSSRSASDKHSIARSNSVVNNYRDHQKYASVRESGGNNSVWNNRENSSTYKDEHYTDHRVQESSSNASSAMICESQTQDMEISSENSTPTSEHCQSTDVTAQQHHQLMDVHVPQSSSSGPGPPIVSSNTTSKLLLHKASRTEIKPDMSSSFNSSLNSITSASVSASLSNDKISESNVTVNQSKMDPSSICDTDGPPTPTHSETQDDLEQKSGGSPETVTTGVSTLQGIQLQGFYPMQLPQLTPGLSQFVKDDLTEHVRGWPAEACERQAHKLATEAHLITSMRITDISIALKSARSRVRLNEIQSTLLEQRVMLYRHEVKSLENMKTPSLFTSDDN